MGYFTLPSSDFPQNHILTVSEGSSDESPSAISLIHTIQISYYLDLISLVNDSCDLEGERGEEGGEFQFRFASTLVQSFWEGAGG